MEDQSRSPPTLIIARPWHLCVPFQLSLVPSDYRIISLQCIVVPRRIINRVPEHIDETVFLFGFVTERRLQQMCHICVCRSPQLLGAVGLAGAGAFVCVGSHFKMIINIIKDETELRQQ